MDIYSRVRAINGAAVKNTRKDVQLAQIRQSFAQHFMDSIDYEPNTLVNGTKQSLLVSKNKSIVTEKKVRTLPGEDIPLGAIIDCYNCKWIVTEIDANRELCVSAKMEQCNREITWQDPDTKEILTRWCTMEKPYFSNLEENKQTSMSQRQYNLQVPYDDDTAKIDVDQRFMLEIINGKPKTYRVTCVDINTERYSLDGSIRGFLLLNIEQDQYNPEKDNIEKMICDYIPPDKNDSAIISKIQYAGAPNIKIGGSAKTFTAKFVDEQTGLAVEKQAIWSVIYLPEFSDSVHIEKSETSLKILLDDNLLLEGASIKIQLQCEGEEFIDELICKAVTLI